MPAWTIRAFTSSLLPTLLFTFADPDPSRLVRLSRWRRWSKNHDLQPRPDLHRRREGLNPRRPRSKILSNLVLHEPTDPQPHNRTQPQAPTLVPPPVVPLPAYEQPSAPSHPSLKNLPTPPSSDRDLHPPNRTSDEDSGFLASSPRRCPSSNASLNPSGPHQLHRSEPRSKRDWPQKRGRRKGSSMRSRRGGGWCGRPER